MRGIYCIKNKINNKSYIGKSINIYDRIRVHKSTLRSGTHENEHLQRSYNKYGEDNFDFFVLVENDNFSDSDLIEVERLYILLFQTNNELFGYNKTSGGQGGCMGYQHNKETKELISKHNSQNKKIMINGIIYDSISDAKRKLDLKINHCTISRRCAKSGEKWKNYSFV